MRVRSEYAVAVERDARNPWWNSRRIVQLITSRRWIEAKRVWHGALEVIDPDGTRAQSDAWLVAHLHYWVAQAWLKVGVWYEARNVLGAVAPAVLREAQRMPRRESFGRLQRDIRQTGTDERDRFEAWLEEHRADASWRRVAELWRAMVRTVPALPAPAADDGEDGPRLSWSQPGGALEWELLSPGEASWGAHDHVRGDSGAGEQALGEGEPALDPSLKAWLGRMARHA